VTDSNNNPINGLNLTYASTEPAESKREHHGPGDGDLPSHATVTAICQPPSCNPAPVNLIGNLGNGMPVAGNRINLSSPGRVTNKIWFASSQSPYFSEIDLSTGGAASPIRLPFTPNSMVMDQAGDTLYFGSYHELMTYSTLTNTLSKEVPGAPGVVLAVSPPARQRSSTISFARSFICTAPRTAHSAALGGSRFVHSIRRMGRRSTSWPGSGDGQNTLFVDSSGTGWSSYPLSSQPAYACPLEQPAPRPRRLQPGVGSLLRAGADDRGAQCCDVPERELDGRTQLLPKHKLDSAVLSAGRDVGVTTRS